MEVYKIAENTEITTLKQFIEWINHLKEQPELSNWGRYLFRGLPNKEYSIEASAWRRLRHEADQNNLERFLELNRGLIKEARLYEHDRENGRELRDLEILAKLQHFRAATCLIDFTYSAQVALFFACQSPDEELTDGKVCLIFDKLNDITLITNESELLGEEIDYFFETNEDGMYPLYQWQPRQLNNRIFPQYSVFLFGGDGIIKPNIECHIPAGSKEKILASLEDFSQMTEATLFPDFEGFVHQRTPGRRYNVPDYKRRGVRAYEDERYEEAIRDFDEAIHHNPNDTDIYILRGHAKHRIEQYSEAIADFDEAISRNPNEAYTYYARGDAKYDQYENKVVIARVKRLQKIDDDVDLKQALHHLEQAKEDLQKALELAKLDNAISLTTRITSTLQEIEAFTDENKEWTPERFKALVPENLRDTYEGPNESQELYNLGADLQSLIQEQRWEITLRFGVKHIFFYSENIRLFGLNLFSTRPRFTFCGITLEEARTVVPEYEFTPYTQYSQLVCQRGPTIEDLQPLFQFVYRKYMSLSKNQEIVDALKHILEDYDYLEYDEEYSRNRDLLHVVVTSLDAERDEDDMWEIRKRLERATGQQFAPVGKVRGNNDWTSFNLRKKRSDHSLN